MAEIRWAPEAVDELEGMPLSQARRIFDTVQLIALLPGMGRVREELGGKRAFPVGHFFIVYGVLENGAMIYVVALLDCRRGDRPI